MGQKAEYRNSARSRNLIRQAFLELLSEKNFSKITVTDIVNRAGINRGTFYAHYPDIRGITEEIEKEVIEKMIHVLHNFQYYSFFENPAPTLLEVNRQLESDLELYRTLINANGAKFFLERLKKIFVDRMLSDETVPKQFRESSAFQLRVMYFSGGIVNLYQKWLEGELDCSLDDIALEIAKLLKLKSDELL